MKRTSISKRVSRLLVLWVGVGMFFVVTVDVARQYRGAQQSLENDVVRIEQNTLPVLSYLVWVLNVDQSIQLGGSLLALPTVTAVSIELVDGVRIFSGFSTHYGKVRDPVVRTWPLEYDRDGERYHLGELRITFLDPWSYASLEGDILQRLLPNILLVVIVLVVFGLSFRSLITAPITRLEHDIDAADFTRDLPSWWSDAAENDTNVETWKVRAVLSSSAERILREIEERKESERLLATWLQEKDMLLKEIHHRVKNNLQLVMSLFALQRRSIDEPAAQRALADSEHRVLSIALVHELLYRGDNVGTVDLADYLRDLSQSIVGAGANETVHIDLRLELQANQKVPLDLAVPVGLIVTELLTNAMKHAFVDRDDGIVSVRAGIEGEASEFVIEISDNGCGLPDSRSDESGSTLGLELVYTLAEQINAVTKIVSDGPGATFRFTIPLDVYKTYLSP